MNYLFQYNRETCVFAICFTTGLSSPFLCLDHGGLNNCYWWNGKRKRKVWLQNGIN